MLVNFIGAMLFSVAGYYYVKNRKKSSFIIHFIPTLEGGKPVASKDAKEETAIKKNSTRNRASRESRKRQIRQNKPKRTRQ